MRLQNIYICSLVTAVFIVGLIVYRAQGFQQASVVERHGTGRTVASSLSPSPAVRLVRGVTWLGECRGGDQRSFEISVVNDSDSEAVVVEVAPSCGCTVLEDSLSVIPSHDAITLSGKINLPIEPGRIEKTVAIRLAHLSREVTLEAKIGATVIAADGIRANPASLKFRDSGVRETATGSFTISGLECHDKICCTLVGLVGIASVEALDCNTQQSSDVPEKSVQVTVDFSHCSSGRHLGSVNCRISGRNDLIVPDPD